LDDDGDAAGAVTLVADVLVILAVAAGSLVDGALDIVLRHALCLGGDDRGTQARIEGGIRQTELGRNRDFTAELGEELSTDFVLLALAMHDVLELGMAGHGLTRSLGLLLIWRIYTQGQSGNKAVRQPQNPGFASSRIPPRRTAATRVARPV